MEPVTVIAALAALAAWVNLLQARRDRLEESERAAIGALSEAVHATRKYSARTAPPVGEGDQPRDRQEEMELSNLWLRASDALYRVEFELGQKCEVKSGYWLEPDRWDEVKISLANISLDSIDKGVTALRRAHLGSH